jgi:hypothetical protein
MSQICSAIKIYGSLSPCRDGATRQAVTTAQQTIDRP